MEYHKFFMDDNGYKYSLDMVRLSLDFGKYYQETANYIKYLSEYDLSVEIKYFPNFKDSFTYRHLWSFVFSGSDASFALGMGLGKDAHIGFIEFNPNKCENDPDFVEIRNYIFSNTFSRDLVRYDLAIDVPYARKSVKLIRDGKKIYNAVVSDTGITEYLGRRSHNGYVKVYDKTKESNLDYDLTRIELTLDKKSDPTKGFPTVWLYDTQYSIILSDDLSDTQQALIRLIRDSDFPSFYLNDLRYRVRKKIEPYLADKVLLSPADTLLQIKALALSYEK